MAEVDNQDPEFLLSRELDGDLTGDERARLETLLRQDAALVRSRESYARLDGLLPRDEPDVDWTRLHDAVMARIAAQSDARVRLLRRVWRIGVPLAAAAAVVFALFGPTVFRLQVRDSGTRRVATVEVTIQRPAAFDGWSAPTAAVDAHADSDAANRPYVYVVLARSSVPVQVEQPPKRRMLVAAGGVRTGLKPTSVARGPF